MARPRRRPFSFLLLLLLPGFGLLGLLRLDLPPPPSFSVPATRAAAQRAVRTLRPDLPAGARLIEQLVAQAEVATAQEIAAPPWRRSAGRSTRRARRAWRSWAA